MVDPASVHSAGGALVAGLVTGIHCAGMCGPVACGVGVAQKDAAGRQRAAVLYQVGRLVAYAAIGGAAGWAGQLPLESFSNSPGIVLPWFLVLVFAAVALGVHLSWPVPGGLRRRFLVLRHRIAQRSMGRGALVVGLATPMLPCAPLYAMFGIALLSGSALQGVEFMLAFGLGTLPLLWLAQSGFHRLKKKLDPSVFGRLQRGVALTAALVMAWRLRGTLPFVDAPDGCPFCP